MTKEEIIGRVETIRGMAGDPETAHSAEDDLYEDVLGYIASLSTYKGEVDGHVVVLAREALMTKAIDFPRWCA